MKLSIGLLGAESLAGGDFTVLRDIVAMADRKGIDQVSVVDHVVMGTDFSEYPDQPFRGASDYPFLEPLVELGTYAAVTSNIRLSSGIVISPLRSAVLLAKQIATLDVLSLGRVEIGLGVGWQSAEYAASGIDFANRYEILEEQIRVCRKLWSGRDVSFHGKHIRFENITAMPQPIQGGNVPIWLGVGLKRRNVERLAELCDGWAPMALDILQLKAGVEALRHAFEARGRDPDALQVRQTYEIRRGGDGKVSLEQTLARTKEYANAGATVMAIPVRRFCRRLEDVEPFLERVVQEKGVA
ncbi:MAG TPA: TIGR03619 family F420-dependent LLM class oxidoreductase [Novosphingobium sp.]|nr:TIGR03619 family F420-dependent LLM class oxidoreductase [Novosphingobium sp.]